MNTNITQLSTEELQAKLNELALMKEKAAVKADKQKAYNEKRRIWMQLMIAKAEKQGIKVSDEEVAEALKKIKKS